MTTTTSTYRFLPWARRGLADTVSGSDTGGALPVRAKVAVGLTVTGSTEATYDLALYGPGDVIGVDTTLIVRTDPRPYATDVEANFFPAIEFDAPDFPWLFTPAASGTNDRLRPWCVLVVVDLDLVDAPRAEAGHPLPVLVVPSAVRGSELPELDESWAWAHTQVLAPAGGTTSASLATSLADDPAMNVARIVAPRRLEPGKRYAACLVPAFDAGVARGLMGSAPVTGTLGPAWSDATPGDVRLPVYYHWEFSTGPAGDFESLARRLKPAVPPETAGVERMYIGAAGPELPALSPADAAAYLDMDGPLRAPQRSNTTLADVPAAMQTALQATLDAAAEQAQSGPSDAAPVLGPPIYGGWQAKQHTVPATTPAWLRELNLDPRARAAAGLGAEIERQHQEDFMQWAWEQVGDILKANALLSQSRLSMEALTSIHTRHVATLPADRALQFSAPLHSRAAQDGVTIRAAIEQSSLPNAAGDPALRRLVSPRNPVRRAAMRRTAVPGAPTPNTPVPGTPLPGTPTGGTPPGHLPLTPVGGVGTVGGVLTKGVTAKTVTTVASPAIVATAATAVTAVTAATTAVGSAAAAAVPPASLIAQLAAGQIAVDPTRFVPGGIAGSSEVLSFVPGILDLETGLAFTGLPAVVLQDAVVALQNLSRTAAGALIPAAPLVRSASALASAAAPPPPPLAPFALVTAKTTLVARTNPRATVLARVQSMLTAGGAPLAAQAAQMPQATLSTASTQLGAMSSAPALGLAVAPTFDRIMAAPELDVPVYRYLAQLDPSRFMPGVGDVPTDSVMLLETNPRFIEALLVGLNSEMNRELLWREFPTDQRGTPFKHFWGWSDGGADVAPIHTWSPGNALGANSRSGAGGQIVLLVRGRLLQRYPNTSIYAWRASGDRLVNPPQPTDVRTPVFTGVLGTDIAFAGFDLTDVDLAQGDGWFFVLQEQPTEPRFGFDEGAGAPATALASWSDASWDDTGTAPGRYLRIASNRLNGVSLGGARFVDHAAHLAFITAQKPVSVAVNARVLLGPTTVPEK